MKAKPHTWTVEHGGKPMFIVTANGRPATIEALYQNENRTDVSSRLDETERLTFITSTTMAACIKRYLHFFGFTWAERPDNVAVAKLK